jgi:uncharacterized protein
MRLTHWATAICSLGLNLTGPFHVSRVPAPNLYSYSVTRQFVTMPDGVKLAVTWWRPTPKDSAETFPVLLELLPYRKDDSFYARDFPLYTYFASHGFIMAKVDIRGTGGSEGRLPEREYSDQELADALEIIRQIARTPRSNGNVGMWGISWGGFNALQVAMLHPPELKAIVALHASDDLYHDDIHYIDGALHVDWYALQIDHENALPRTPDYQLDSAYFRDRFEAEPWIFTYLRHSVDGAWWREHALRWNYSAIQIPTYFIGGLLDGYRDTPIRALDQLKAPIKVEIGPWNHAWPDDGTPGPNYEWRARVVEWWNHWLRGNPTKLLGEPTLLVYVRDSVRPDPKLATTPGEWRLENWPISRTRWDTLALLPDNRLGALGRSGSTAGDSTSISLRYFAGYGVTAGDWWGEPTGDMRRDDAGSLVWDGPALNQSVEIIGMPRVRLRVTPGAPLATWTVRLEDIFPDGSVALVAGGLLNGTQARSSENPERMHPGETYDLTIPLHFTTWTYRAGHRVRLSVSNAQFPMIWPTPYPMTSVVHLGTEKSVLELPVIPPVPTRQVNLPAPEPRQERPDVKDIDVPGVPSQVVRYDPLSGVSSVQWKFGYAWTIGATRYDNTEQENYETNESNPSSSRFLGVEVHRIRRTGRDLRLETTIDIRSDSTAFHVRVLRRISEKGKLVRSKEWKESIPREFH